MVHDAVTNGTAATREKAMAKFRDAWMKVIETRREPRPV
jgi:predicted RNase H-like HicB family nuclease